MDDCKMYYTYNQGGTAYFGDEENCIHTGKLDGKQYKHFYEDPDMCEWVALPTAGQQWGGQQNGMLPRWIMDWGPSEGFDHVVGGFPCFNSESYLEWYDNQITEGFLYPLISNLIRLKQMGKEYLFAGVATGWETMIPDYSEDVKITRGSVSYYNAHLYGWEHGLYGYHALYNMGYRSEAEISAAAPNYGFPTSNNCMDFKRASLCGIIQGYISHTCKLFYDKGISRGKIFSHTLAYASQWKEHNIPFETFTVPMWVNINEYCTPSWSMTGDSPYNMTYINAALAKYSPGYNSFANSEGYMHSYAGGGYSNEQSYFESFLGGNARLITFFGYDMDDGHGGYVKDGSNPYNGLVTRWMQGSVLPGYYYRNRPDLSSFNQYN